MRSRNTERQHTESSYPYALRLLTARDYSVTRILGKLLAVGISELDASATIVRLQSEGWLNDRRYAERFAESALSSGRFHGPRLWIEMRRRGFETDLVDDVLNVLLEDFDEVSQIRVIVARRYPDFSFSAAPDRDKQRIIGYLQRRGFGLSAIITALKGFEA